MEDRAREKVSLHHPDDLRCEPELTPAPLEMRFSRMDIPLPYWMVQEALKGTCGGDEDSYWGAWI